MQFFIGIFLCAFVSVSSDIWLCIVVEKVKPLRSNDHKTTAWLQEQVVERGWQGKSYSVEERNISELVHSTTHSLCNKYYVFLTHTIDFLEN